MVKLVNVFSPSRTEAVSQKLTEQISEYQKSARYFKENKNVFARNLVTSLVQILALYSIPFLVYKSFGLSQYNWAEAVSLQAVLYVAVAALPLPGALGVSESGFMMLFKTMFPVGLLGSAMILSRGISFYLFVLISGLSVAFFSLAGRKVNRIERKES